jgi:hypothetical protein
MKNIILLFICLPLLAFETSDWKVREDGKIEGRHLLEHGKKFILEARILDEARSQAQGITHFYHIGLPSFEAENRTTISIEFNDSRLVGIGCNQLGVNHTYGFSDLNSDGILDCLNVFGEKGILLGAFTLAHGKLEPVDDETKALLVTGGEEAIHALKDLIQARLEPVE